MLPNIELFLVFAYVYVLFTYRLYSLMLDQLFGASSKVLKSSNL